MPKYNPWSVRQRRKRWWNSKKSGSPFAKYEFIRDTHKTVKPYQDRLFIKAGLPPIKSLFHPEHDYKQPLISENMPQRKRKGSMVTRPGKRRKIGGPRSSNSSTLIKEGGVKVSRKQRFSKKAKSKRRWKLKVRKALLDTDQTHVLLEIADKTSILSGGGTSLDQAVYANVANGKNDLRLGDTNNPACGLRRYIDELKSKIVIGQALPSNSATTNVKGIYNNIDRTVLHVTSAVCNIGFTNISLTQNIVLDIYECVNRKKNELNDDTAHAAWSVSVNANQSPSQPVPNAVMNWTRPAITDAGNTPYLTIGFGNYWKILKKTSMIIPAAQKANYTYSLGKHTIKFDISTGAMGYVKDLIIVANSSQNDDQPFATPLCQIEWNKSYTFKWDNGPEIHGQSIVGAYKYL